MSSLSLAEPSGIPSSPAMVVDGTMLDGGHDTAHPGHCSDCGGSLSTPHIISDQDRRGSRPPPGEPPLTGDSSSRCASCLSDGGRSHRLDPHSCPMCTKTFISSSHLALHLSAHSKERKFKCNICEKYFHQSSHLMAHKMIHSGDRPFKCPDCGKNFGRASHLKTHSRLHTGEKPFKCTYCEKAFTQKAGLLSHVRLHNGERPHKCDQCGEAFRSLAHLLSHKAQESPGRATEPSELDDGHQQQQRQQQQTNGGHEDLKCGVCCRSFVRSSYIRLYIRLSKGQRPYHCKVCNKTFVKLNTFVNHCDKHLRAKREKSRQVKEEVVKPPLFVPLSGPSSPQPSPPPPVEVNTRSRAKGKGKTEL